MRNERTRKATYERTFCRRALRAVLAKFTVEELASIELACRREEERGAGHA